MDAFPKTIPFFQKPGAWRGHLTGKYRLWFGDEYDGELFGKQGVGSKRGHACPCPDPSPCPRSLLSLFFGKNGQGEGAREGGRALGQALRITRRGLPARATGRQNPTRIRSLQSRHSGLINNNQRKHARAFALPHLQHIHPGRQAAQIRFARLHHALTPHAAGQVVQHIALRQIG